MEISSIYWLSEELHHLHPNQSLCVCLRVSVCLGTHNKFSMVGGKDTHYESMVRMYSNCSVVLENLEVTHTLEHHDLSFLQVRLSVSLSVYLPVHPSACLSVYLPVCPCCCLSVCLSVHPPVCLSVCLSVHPSICQRRSSSSSSSSLSPSRRWVATC